MVAIAYFPIVTKPTGCASAGPTAVVLPMDLSVLFCCVREFRAALGVPPFSGHRSLRGDP